MNILIYHLATAQQHDIRSLS